jgi:hypothetical protein
LSVTSPKTVRGGKYRKKDWGWEKRKKAMPGKNLCKKKGTIQFPAMKTLAVKITGATVCLSGV